MRLADFHSTDKERQKQLLSSRDWETLATEYAVGRVRLFEFRFPLAPSRNSLRKENTTLSRIAGSERGTHTRTGGHTDRSRRTTTHANHDSDESSEDDEDEEEDQLLERTRQDQTDLPTEYWQIQRLVKYLKVEETALARSIVYGSVLGRQSDCHGHRSIIDSGFQSIRRNMPISHSRCRWIGSPGESIGNR